MLEILNPKRYNFIFLYLKVFSWSNDCLHDHVQQMTQTQASTSGSGWTWNCPHGPGSGYLSHFEYFLKSTGLNLYLHGWLSVSASVCMYHHLPINKSLHILNYNTLFISAKQLQKPLNKLFKSDTWLTRHFYRIQLQWLTLPAQHHPIPDLWREQNWSWSSLYRLAYQLHNFSWLIVKSQHFLWNLYFY